MCREGVSSVHQVPSRVRGAAGPRVPSFAPGEPLKVDGGVCARRFPEVDMGVAQLLVQVPKQCEKTPLQQAVWEVGRRGRRTALKFVSIFFFLNNVYFVHLLLEIRGLEKYALGNYIYRTILKLYI